MTVLVVLLVMFVTSGLLRSCDGDFGVSRVENNERGVDVLLMGRTVRIAAKMQRFTANIFEGYVIVCEVCISVLPT